MEELISRAEVDQRIYDYAESNGLSYANMKNYILDLPPVTPTHGKCKDCSHYDPLTCNSGTCLNPNMQWSNEVSATHYCADFEKRGSENEVN